MKMKRQGVVPAGSAAADGLPVQTPCTEQRDVEGPEYLVKLCDVTDADQHRTALLNQGKYYCGPTTLFNVMYYLGEHKGLPMRMAPNGQLLTAHDPHKAADYAKATEWIGWLGTKAGMTVKSESTSVGGNRAAGAAAPAGAPQAGWGIARDWNGSDAEKGVAEFGREIASRLRYAPVHLWFGHYTKNADNTYTRNGGHAITVVEAKGEVGSGKVELIVHDPALAADSNTDTQSAVRDEKITLTKSTIVVKKVDKDTGVETLRTRIYWRLTGDGYAANKFAEAFQWYAAAPPVG
jgi:hypothetical protein